MELDVDRLRNGLEEYHATVLRHRKQLESEYADLHRHFNGLFEVYGGNMANEFRQRWTSTAQWFEDYLNKTAELDRFLSERIEQLHHI